MKKIKNSSEGVQNIAVPGVPVEVSRYMADKARRLAVEKGAEWRKERARKAAAARWAKEAKGPKG